MVRETRYLIVRNLPQSCTEDTVIEHFQRYGKIQSVKLQTAKDNDTDSTATVAFNDIKSAAKAHHAKNCIGEVTLRTDYWEGSTGTPALASTPVVGNNTVRSAVYTSTTPASSRLASTFSNWTKGPADEDSSSTHDKGDTPATVPGNNTPVTASPALDKLSSTAFDLQRGRGRDRVKQKKFGQKFEKCGGSFGRHGTTTSTRSLEAARSQSEAAAAAAAAVASSSAVTPNQTAPTSSASSINNGSTAGLNPIIVSDTKEVGGRDLKEGHRESSSRSRPHSVASPSSRNSGVKKSNSHSRSVSRSRSRSRGSRSSSSRSHSSGTSQSTSPHRSHTSSTTRPQSMVGSSRLVSSEVKEAKRDDNEERRNLGICVMGLPIRSTDSSLRDGLYHEYKKQGKVTTVQICGDGENRCAIVSFRKPEDAIKALEASHGKTFFGAKIRVVTHEGVEVDDTERGNDIDSLDEYHVKSTRTLFVGNLEKETTTQDLIDKFKQFGEIIDVDIKRQGATTAFAFVQYADILSVVTALREMEGEHMGINKIKLGFGKSMPTDCVWLGCLPTDASGRLLRSTMARFGEVVYCYVDRLRNKALVYFSAYEDAQHCVSDIKTRPHFMKKKLQIDFASRECQNDFFERMERTNQLRANERPDDTNRVHRFRQQRSFDGFQDDGSPAAYPFTRTASTFSTRNGRSSSSSTSFRRSRPFPDATFPDENHSTTRRSRRQEEYGQSGQFYNSKGSTDDYDAVLREYGHSQRERRERDLSPRHSADRHGDSQSRQSSCDHSLDRYEKDRTVEIYNSRDTSPGSDHNSYHSENRYRSSRDEKYSSRDRYDDVKVEEKDFDHHSRVSRNASPFVHTHSSSRSHDSDYEHRGGSRSQSPPTPIQEDSSIHRIYYNDEYKRSVEISDDYSSYSNSQKQKDSDDVTVKSKLVSIHSNKLGAEVLKTVSKSRKRIHEESGLSDLSKLDGKLLRKSEKSLSSDKGKSLSDKEKKLHHEASRQVSKGHDQAGSPGSSGSHGGSENGSVSEGDLHHLHQEKHHILRKLQELNEEGIGTSEPDSPRSVSKIKSVAVKEALRLSGRSHEDRKCDEVFAKGDSHRRQGGKTRGVDSRRDSRSHVSEEMSSTREDKSLDEKEESFAGNSDSDYGSDFRRIKKRRTESSVDIVSVKSKGHRRASSVVSDDEELDRKSDHSFRIHSGSVVTRVSCDSRVGSKSYADTSKTVEISSCDSSDVFKGGLSDKDISVIKQSQPVSKSNTYFPNKDWNVDYGGTVRSPVGCFSPACSDDHTQDSVTSGSLTEKSSEHLSSPPWQHAPPLPLIGKDISYGEYGYFKDFTIPGNMSPDDCLSDDSIEGDMLPAPGEPSVEDRIRAIDEMLNMTVSNKSSDPSLLVSVLSNKDIANNNDNTALYSKFRIRKREGGLDGGNVLTERKPEPSVIMQQVLSKKSILDQDFKRLEQMCEKYDLNSGREFLKTDVASPKLVELKGDGYLKPLLSPSLLISPSLSHPVTTSSSMLQPTITTSVAGSTSSFSVTSSSMLTTSVVSAPITTCSIHTLPKLAALDASRRSRIKASEASMDISDRHSICTNVLTLKQDIIVSSSSLSFPTLTFTNNSLSSSVSQSLTNSLPGTLSLTETASLTTQPSCKFAVSPSSLPPSLLSSSASSTPNTCVSSTVHSQTNLQHSVLMSAYVSSLSSSSLSVSQSISEAPVAAPFTQGPDKAQLTPTVGQEAPRLCSPSFTPENSRTSVSCHLPGSRSPRVACHTTDNDELLKTNSKTDLKVIVSSNGDTKTDELKATTGISPDIESPVSVQSESSSIASVPLSSIDSKTNLHLDEKTSTIPPVIISQSTGSLHTSDVNFSLNNSDSVKVELVSPVLDMEKPVVELCEKNQQSLRESVILYGETNKAADILVSSEMKVCPPLTNQTVLSVSSKDHSEKPHSSVTDMSSGGSSSISSRGKLSSSSSLHATTDIDTTSALKAVTTSAATTPSTSMSSHTVSKSSLDKNDKKTSGKLNSNSSKMSSGPAKSEALFAPDVKMEQVVKASDSRSETRHPPAKGSASNKSSSSDRKSAKSVSKDLHENKDIQIKDSDKTEKKSDVEHKNSSIQESVSKNRDIHKGKDKRDQSKDSDKGRPKDKDDNKKKEERKTSEKKPEKKKDEKKGEKKADDKKDKTGDKTKVVAKPSQAKHSKVESYGSKQDKKQKEKVKDVKDKSGDKKTTTGITSISAKQQVTVEVKPEPKSSQKTDSKESKTTKHEAVKDSSMKSKKEATQKSETNGKNEQKTKHKSDVKGAGKGLSGVKSESKESLTGAAVNKKPSQATKSKKEQDKGGSKHNLGKPGDKLLKLKQTEEDKLKEKQRLKEEKDRQKDKERVEKELKEKEEKEKQKEKEEKDRIEREERERKEKEEKVKEERERQKEKEREEKEKEQLKEKEEKERQKEKEREEKERQKEKEREEKERQKEREKEEKEKQKEKEKEERERQKEKQKEEKEEKERQKEKEREERERQKEKEKEEKQRQKEKEKEEKERQREKEREEKERQKEKDREQKEKEREEKERQKEKEIEEKERQKKEREERHKEMEKEERERQKEKEKDEKERQKEKEKDEKERQKEEREDKERQKEKEREEKERQKEKERDQKESQKEKDDKEKKEREDKEKVRKEKEEREKQKQKEKDERETVKEKEKIGKKIKVKDEKQKEKDKKEKQKDKKTDKKETEKKVKDGKLKKEKEKFKPEKDEKSKKDKEEKEKANRDKEKADKERKEKEDKEKKKAAPKKPKRNELAALLEHNDMIQMSFTSMYDRVKTQRNREPDPQHKTEPAPKSSFDKFKQNRKKNGSKFKSPLYTFDTSSGASDDNDDDNNDLSDLSDAESTLKNEPASETKSKKSKQVKKRPHVSSSSSSSCEEDDDALLRATKRKSKKTDKFNEIFSSDSDDDHFQPPSKLKASVKGKSKPVTKRRKTREDSSDSVTSRDEFVKPQVVSSVTDSLDDMDMSDDDDIKTKRKKSKAKPLQPSDHDDRDSSMESVTRKVAKTDLDSSLESVPKITAKADKEESPPKKTKPESKKVTKPHETKLNVKEGPKSSVNEKKKGKSEPQKGDNKTEPGSKTETGKQKSKMESESKSVQKTKAKVESEKSKPKVKAVAKPHVEKPKHKVESENTVDSEKSWPKDDKSREEEKPKFKVEPENKMVAEKVSMESERKLHVEEPKNQLETESKHVTEKRSPTVTEKPSPTVAEKPSPTVTEKPSPTVTEKPRPTVTEKSSPTVTEKSSPTVTEKPRPIVTEKPSPPVTEKPSPPVTEKPRPVTEKPSPTVTEKPRPVVTDKPSPTVTEKPSPTVTEKPRPVVTDKPRPVVTDKPSPTVTEKPRPVSEEKQCAKVEMESRSHKEKHTPMMESDNKFEAEVLKMEVESVSDTETTRCKVEHRSKSVEKVMRSKAEQRTKQDDERPVDVEGKSNDDSLRAASLEPETETADDKPASKVIPADVTKSKFQAERKKKNEDKEDGLVKKKKKKKYDPLKEEELVNSLITKVYDKLEREKKDKKKSKLTIFDSEPEDSSAQSESSSKTVSSHTEKLPAKIEDLEPTKPKEEKVDSPKESVKLEKHADAKPVTDEVSKVPKKKTKKKKDKVVDEVEEVVTKDQAEKKDKEKPDAEMKHEKTIKSEDQSDDEHLKPPKKKKKKDHDNDREKEKAVKVGRSPEKKSNGEKTQFVGSEDNRNMHEDKSSSQFVDEFTSFWGHPKPILIPKRLKDSQKSDDEKVKHKDEFKSGGHTDSSDASSNAKDDTGDGKEAKLSATDDKLSESLHGEGQTADLASDAAKTPKTEPETIDDLIVPISEAETTVVTELAVITVDSVSTGMSLAMHEESLVEESAVLPDETTIGSSVEIDDDDFPSLIIDEVPESVEKKVTKKDKKLLKKQQVKELHDHMDEVIASVAMALSSDDEDQTTLHIDSASNDQELLLSDVINQELKYDNKIPCESVPKTAIITDMLFPDKDIKSKQSSVSSLGNTQKDKEVSAGSGLAKKEQDKKKDTIKIFGQLDEETKKRDEELLKTLAVLCDPNLDKLVVIDDSKREPTAEEIKMKEAADKKKAEEERRKLEEDKKKAEEEAKKKAEEEKKRAEEERKRVQEEKKKAEEEAKRAEEERKKAEEEEERRKVEEEKKRVEEEKKRVEEEKKRAEEEEKRKIEEEKTRREKEEQALRDASDEAARAVESLLEFQSGFDQDSVDDVDDDLPPLFIEPADKEPPVETVTMSPAAEKNDPVSIFSGPIPDKVTANLDDKLLEKKFDEKGPIDQADNKLDSFSLFATPTQTAALAPVLTSPRRNSVASMKEKTPEPVTSPQRQMQQSPQMHSPHRIQFPSQRPLQSPPNLMQSPTNLMQSPQKSAMSPQMDVHSPQPVLQSQRSPFFGKDAKTDRNFVLTNTDSLSHSHVDIPHGQQPQRRVSTALSTQPILDQQLRPLQVSPRRKSQEFLPEQLIVSSRRNTIAAPEDVSVTHLDRRFPPYMGTDIIFSKERTHSISSLPPPVSISLDHAPHDTNSQSPMQSLNIPSHQDNILLSPKKASPVLQIKERTPDPPIFPLSASKSTLQEPASHFSKGLIQEQMFAQYPKSTTQEQLYYGAKNQSPELFRPNKIAGDNVLLHTKSPASEKTILQPNRGPDALLMPQKSAGQELALQHAKGSHHILDQFSQHEKGLLQREQMFSPKSQPDNPFSYPDQNIDFLLNSPPRNNVTFPSFPQTTEVNLPPVAKQPDFSHDPLFISVAEVGTRPTDREPSHVRRTEGFPASFYQEPVPGAKIHQDKVTISLQQSPVEDDKKGARKRKRNNKKATNEDRAAALAEQQAIEESVQANVDSIRKALNANQAKAAAEKAHMVGTDKRKTPDAYDFEAHIGQDIVGTPGVLTSDGGYSSFIEADAKPLRSRNERGRGRGYGARRGKRGRGANSSVPEPTDAHQRPDSLPSSQPPLNFPNSDTLQPQMPQHPLQQFGLPQPQLPSFQPQPSQGNHQPHAYSQSRQSPVSSENSSSLPGPDWQQKPVSQPYPHGHVAATQQQMLQQQQQPSGRLSVPKNDVLSSESNKQDLDLSYGESELIINLDDQPSSTEGKENQYSLSSDGEERSIIPSPSTPKSQRSTRARKQPDYKAIASGNVPAPVQLRSSRSGGSPRGLGNGANSPRSMSPRTRSTENMSSSPVVKLEKLEVGRTTRSRREIANKVYGKDTDNERTPTTNIFEDHKSNTGADESKSVSKENIYEFVDNEHEQMIETSLRSARARKKRVSDQEFPSQQQQSLPDYMPASPVSASNSASNSTPFGQESRHGFDLHAPEVKPAEESPKLPHLSNVDAIIEAVSKGNFGSFEDAPTPEVAASTAAPPTSAVSEPDHLPAPPHTRSTRRSTETKKEVDQKAEKTFIIAEPPRFEGREAGRKGPTVPPLRIKVAHGAKIEKNEEKHYVIERVKGAGSTTDSEKPPLAFTVKLTDTGTAIMKSAGGTSTTPLSSPQLPLCVGKSPSTTGAEPFKNDSLRKKDSSVGLFSGLPQNEQHNSELDTVKSSVAVSQVPAWKSVEALPDEATVTRSTGALHPKVAAKVQASQESQISVVQTQTSTPQTVQQYPPSSAPSISSLSKPSSVTPAAPHGLKHAWSSSLQQDAHHQPVIPDQASSGSCLPPAYHQNLSQLSSPLPRDAQIMQHQQQPPPGVHPEAKQPPNAHSQPVLRSDRPGKANKPGGMEMNPDLASKLTAEAQKHQQAPFTFPSHLPPAHSGQRPFIMPSDQPGHHAPHFPSGSLLKSGPDNRPTKSPSIQSQVASKIGAEVRTQTPPVTPGGMLYAGVVSGQPHSLSPSSASPEGQVIERIQNPIRQTESGQSPSPLSLHLPGSHHQDPVNRFMKDDGQDVPGPLSGHTERTPSRELAMFQHMIEQQRLQQHLLIAEAARNSVSDPTRNIAAAMRNVLESSRNTPVALEGGRKGSLPTSQAVGHGQPLNLTPQSDLRGGQTDPSRVTPKSTPPAPQSPFSMQYFDRKGDSGRLSATVTGSFMQPSPGGHREGLAPHLYPELSLANLPHSSYMVGRLPIDPRIYASGQQPPPHLMREGVLPGAFPQAFPPASRFPVLEHPDGKKNDSGHPDVPGPHMLRSPSPIQRQIQADALRQQLTRMPCDLPTRDSPVGFLQRYPVMWQGALALKNDNSYVQMHFIAGNRRLPNQALPQPMQNGALPPLRISQRMRLEHAQLEGVAKRMQCEDHYCILIAVACGRDQMDINQQTRALNEGFITYLLSKQAAGIVNVPLPGSEQVRFVVHIFPPCEFVDNSVAHQGSVVLMEQLREVPHAVVIIATT